MIAIIYLLTLMMISIYFIVEICINKSCSLNVSLFGLVNVILLSAWTIDYKLFHKKM